MVPGAQKSGTTWLFECLIEHPEVFVPRVKELHYYCPAESCRFSKKHLGLDWYLDQFRDAKKAKAIGDLTTDYMFYPEIAQELYRLNSETKFVFLLRDPVSRAYSAYWMWRRHNVDLKTFSALVDRQNTQDDMKHGLVRRGFYYEQIKPYIELFGREQIQIHIYEEIVKNPGEFMRELYKFIGVDPAFVPKSLLKKVGDTKNYPPGIGKMVYKGVSRILNTRYVMPAWRALRHHTNIKEKALQLIGYSQSEASYPEMEITDMLRLQEIYREKNDELRELMERQSNIWPY